MKAWMRIFFYGVLAWAVITQASAQSNLAAKVSSDGVTEVSMRTGKAVVTVKITTHKLDIGADTQVPPQQRSTNCTYSRFPCSLVDDVEIFVGLEPLFVARSVYSDLADLVEARISEPKPKLYVLSMKGGDGAEGYMARVTFDRSRVRLREIMDTATGKIRQRTTYLPQPSLN